MSIGYQDVLERLKEERLKKNKTQEQMGKMMRMTQSHYSKVEQGKKRFSYYETLCLCEMDVDSFYIFTGKRGEEKYKEELLDCSYEELLSFYNIICSVVEYFYINKRTVQWEIIYEQIKYVKGVMAFVKKNSNVFYCLRRLLGYNQQKMSEIIQVDIKKLREMENGKVLPDSEMIWRMYYLYGIPPAIVMKSKRDIIKTIDNLLCEMDEKNRNVLLSYFRQIH